MGERITATSLPENCNQHKDKTVSIEAGRNGKKWPGIQDIWESTTLPAAARLVYAVLCGHANENGQPLWLPDRPPGFLAWPGVTRIAQESGLTDRGVQKAIAQLIEAGTIQCVFLSKGGGASKRRHGNGISNVYKVGLLTPNSVHRTTVNSVHPKPRTESQRTPNSVPENGELSSPELINRTTNKEQQQQHAREARSAAVADDAVFSKRLEQAKPHFKRIEEQLGAAISGKTRADLQRSIQAQGFSSAQLAYAFALYGRTYKTVGGLITFARSLKEHASAIETWPCLTCYGTGTVDSPESPYGGLLPCTCPVGERREREFPGIAEYRSAIADGRPFCRSCQNTGTVRDLDGDMPCDHCARGREVADQRKRESDEQISRRETLLAAGNCPDCAGEGIHKFNDKNLRCLSCRGTGLAQQPPGSCGNCWGERVDWLGRACDRCAQSKAS